MTGRVDATVIGEALVDVVRSPCGERAVAGGSPLNVAVGLARLGLRTCLVTELGDDDGGAIVRRHLAESGVVEDGIEATEATSRAHATIGEDGSAQYRFDVQWTLGHGAAPKGRLVHAGSISAVLEPGATSVAERMSRRPASAIGSIDPNIRPALMGDPARAAATFERLARGVDVVKLSEEDAAWLYPCESLSAVGDRFLRSGAALFAVTRGGAGAELRAPDAMVQVGAEAVDVVDTIGAGDAFMAGMLAALLREGGLTTLRRGLTSSELSRVGALAARCAAITVSRAGADPPWERELDAKSLPVTDPPLPAREHIGAGALHRTKRNRSRS